MLAWLFLTFFEAKRQNTDGAQKVETRAQILNFLQIYWFCFVLAFYNNKNRHSAAQKQEKELQEAIKGPIPSHRVWCGRDRPGS